MPIMGMNTVFLKIFWVLHDKNMHEKPESSINNAKLFLVFMLWP